MENKKSFGAFLGQRRKELGLTQKELAQREFPIVKDTTPNITTPRLYGT